MQDLRLGMDLVGKFRGLPCWDAALTGEGQRCGQTRLGKAVVPIGMFVGWVWGRPNQIRLQYPLVLVRE